MSGENSIITIGNGPSTLAPRAVASLTLRICLVVPYDLADEGGVKRHAVHLARCLRNRGDEVTIIGPMSRGAAGDGMHGFGGVVNVSANGATNYVALLTPPWEVRRFFREHAFDVVHVHEPFVPMLTYYALWLSPPAAHVATFHMYAEAVSPGWASLRKALGRLLHGSIDRAIAVSRPAEAFARTFWRAPVTVIPNGVPVSVFDRIAPGAGLDRGTEGPGRPLRLLFVGNWRDERKGLSFLLEAYQRLRGEGLALTLDVVGSGRPRAAERIDGVTFHGAVAREEDLAGFYRRCDVFVSPATGQESFGIVLLEAMAAGRAIVCSNIDGYREVAPPGGARLVRAADAGSLADGVRAVARDPDLRRQMGVVNREAVEAYEWERLAGRIREEYLLALASAGRPVEDLGHAAPEESEAAG